ncbi:chemotaxis protein CheW, partial [Escherichia coli]|uniref:chemotaxis protein CheW n=1 Tax=Escherichia coli TaxID=562 RepID=UPI0022836A95
PFCSHELDDPQYYVAEEGFTADERRVGEETFILPLNHVTESLQPTNDQIYSVAGNERVMHVRGEYLPLVELYRVFEVDGAKTDATQGIVVILQSAGRRYA